ncbi:PKD domain-containing protein [Paraflavitalea pollutisoli]|uniref:PKD domain-containing protein n=1 Tax=Paraflavitalea pollutisoli TaxID=3034143 RepID=UPI0023ECACA4|nr:PKD domain-containing protein [Paraflavitalea sp. H1-2-19X]
MENKVASNVIRKSWQSCCITLLLLLLGATAFSQTVANFTVNKTAGCVPLSGVNFTDASTGSTVVNRRWDLGNGTIIPNGGSVAGTNYLTDGTYIIILTTTFANGDIRTAQQTITVHPKPVAKFSAVEREGCSPHAVQFTEEASSKTGTVTNYLWDFGAGGSNQPDPAFTYNVNGNYNVSLIVTNSWGCESEAAIQPQYIKVYPKVAASFNIPNNSSCETPFTTSFVNTSTGGGNITYQWDFGDGQTSTDPNPTHTYTTTGAYNVTLTARNGTNCVSTFTRSGNNGILAGKPVPSITAPATVCANNNTAFSAGITPAAFIYTIKWLFPDNGAVQYGQNVNHLFTVPGTYDIKMVAFNYAGCNDTATHTITVRPGPQPNFTVDRAIGCDTPFVVRFTNTTLPATGLTYEWNFGDGTPRSTDPAPVHTYKLPGYYTVTLVATDPLTGCQTTMQKRDTIRIVKPIVDFTYTPPAGCRPLPVKATARLSNIVIPVATYIWNFGDGTILTTTADNATHTYTVAGDYNIKLTIITQQGCRDSSVAKKVTIIDLCDDDGSGGGGGGGGGGGFTIGKDCDDKYTITFTDTVSNSETLSWDFGDGSPLYATPPANPVTHTFPTTNKKYVVTVSRRNKTTNVPSTGQVRAVIIDEKANFVPSITDICRNKTVNFSTLGIDSSNIARFIWNFGDGTPRYTINNLNYFQNYGQYLNGNTTHTYADTGTFYVKLIIWDKLNCADSFQYAIPVRVKGPIPGFEALPRTTCEKDLLTIFQDTSVQNGSTPIVEWTWNFGDGTPAYITTQDTAISHAYSNNSYYRFWTVTLNVKDAAGCEAQAVYNNYIRSYRPKADFFSYDTLKCGSTNVYLYNQSSAYNATYTWYFGDGTSSSSYSASHTYSTNGEYDIKLVVTDENGCADSITTAAYIKLVKPKANFTVGDTSKCAPIAINFFDSSTYAKQYVWDFGDGGTGATDKDPAPHIYAMPGYYPVTLIITGVSGCMDTVVKTIRVKGPIGQLTVGPAIGCTPYTLPLKVTGSNISSYAWDYGDGTPVQASLDDVVNHVYPLAGKYLPNVVLTSPEGCPYTLKATDTVIVDSARAKFSVDRPLRCLTDRTIQFNNLSETAFGAVSYKWLFGDNQTSADENPTHTYTTNGDYEVWAIVQSRYGCIDTLKLPKAVSIRQQPEALFQADSMYCSPGIKTFNNQVRSADPIAQLKWYVDGAFAGNTAQLTHPLTPGIHTIALAATTIHGCVDSAAHRVQADLLSADYSINKPIRCGDDRTIPFTNLSTAHFGVAAWKWQMGDQSNATDQHPVHTYTAPGEYHTSLILYGNSGCNDTVSLAQPVKIYAKPLFNIIGEMEKCAENNMDFRSAILSEDKITSYSWTLNQVPIGTTDQVSHYFDRAGRYNLSFTVNTLYGCRETADTTITIHRLPVPTVSPRDTTVCIESLVPLQAHDGTQYQWSPAINLQYTDRPDALATALVNTQYFVQVTNQYGCVQKDSATIRVDHKVALQHSDNAIICRGQRTRLTASGNTNRFAWLPVIGLDAPQSPVTWASPHQTTDYQVVAYSLNTCPNDTGRINVLVGDIPTVDQGPDLSVDAGRPVVLNPITSSDVISYQWQPATGLNCITCSTPQFIADKDVAYRVSVRTQYNCESSDEIRITVTCGKGAVYIPNAFTPNGDGTNDIFFIKGYGIQQVNSLRIYNRWGQSVFSRENFLPNDRNAGWDGKVNGQVPESGAYVYIAEVICAEGKPLPLKGTVMLIK